MQELIGRVTCGDCLEVMKRIDDKSIDMILCDLPYGTTACKWDTVIPLEPLWEQYKRVIKDNGAIVLTASQPFTSVLNCSNIQWFKYQWYWIKARPTGFANSKKQPMRNVEDVCVFYKNLPVYNPQGLEKVDRVSRNSKSTGGESLRTDVIESRGKGSLRTPGKEFVSEFANYPRQTLEIKHDSKKIHPTQKPVALFEYLIRTYTNENDLILDNCAGSGTTGIAAIKTNRQFILIEKEPKYCAVFYDRLAKECQQ